MYLENMELSSKQDIANQFNSYFVNIGKRLSKSISNPSHSTFQDYFSCQNLEYFGVNFFSSSIKSSKANGPDSISPRVVKECIHYIVNPLCDIFNMSLSFGIYST